MARRLSREAHTQSGILQLERRLQHDAPLIRRRNRRSPHKILQVSAKSKDDPFASCQGVGQWEGVNASVQSVGRQVQVDAGFVDEYEVFTFVVFLASLVETLSMFYAIGIRVQ